MLPEYLTRSPRLSEHSSGAQTNEVASKPENSRMQKQEREEQDGIRLRRDFVSMLFALAASQVAIFAYAVFEAKAPYVGCTSAEHWWCFMAALAHLALALLVIATSWVGWSRSKSAAQAVHGVFDRDFVPWILDVLLVVVYFFLASSVEVQTALTGHTQLTPPSIEPELKWTIWLMALYVAWDACTKWYPKGGLPSGISRIPNACAYTFASAATVISLLVFKWGVEKYVQSISAQDVLILDIGLMALVVLFRVLKSAEKAWFEKWGWRERTDVTAEAGWLVKTICCLLVAVASCGVAFYFFP